MHGADPKLLALLTEVRDALEDLGREVSYLAVATARPERYQQVAQRHLERYGLLQHPHR